MDIWNILGIVAIIILAASFAIGKNAIWGTLTMGVIVCVIWAIINLVSDNPLNWLAFKKVAIVSVLIGALFEIPRFLKKS